MKKIIENLLYLNRKVIVLEDKEPQAKIYTYNLNNVERITLLVSSICEVINSDCKEINASNDLKTHMVTTVIKDILTITNTDFSIKATKKEG